MTAVHMHENTGTHKRKSSRETKNTVKHKSYLQPPSRDP